ncbi:hypothetical protein F5J12DRAFT_796039 [Pisolithus orientalis]|uniref:uncharacterized protein n=1 Tax=Pisolithus orientalis TaxID=936130 RepID=UPI002225729A|nr:uncharacterized protein F5J12DRAFT_796039 [Pisolithus orientalis]KAI6032711.1 hypothetical protein F5J12DRAFT_796039 [Pisolithus orientalis]
MRKKLSISYASFGVPAPFDPSFALVTSPLPFLPPLVLGAVRGLLALYTLITAVVILGLDSAVYNSGPSYLSYFTSLSYIGLCAYFWASSVQTIAFARAVRNLRSVQDDTDAGNRGQKKTERDLRVEHVDTERRIYYPLQKWPRPLQLMHVLLYTSIVVYPIIVTIVFWALLSSPQTLMGTYNAWANISRHILNSAFAVFEITCTNVPPLPWSHIGPVFIVIALYLGVAYITRATQGFYTYSFLDPGSHPGRVAAYIFGIAVGYCIVFAVVKGIITLRCRLARRRWESKEDAGRPGAPEALDEWEEVDHPQRSSRV